MTHLRFFPIHCSCALQQGIHGSPLACPVLRRSPIEWKKPCNLQVFPDSLHPHVAGPDLGSSPNEVGICVQQRLLVLPAGCGLHDAVHLWTPYQCSLGILERTIVILPASVAFNATKRNVILQVDRSPLPVVML